VKAAWRAPAAGHRAGAAMPEVFNLEEQLEYSDD